MLPAEIEQFTLILPAPSDHAGTVQAARFTIEPSHEITVAATGDRLLPESIIETVKSGRREIELPHPSSPGLIDADGATITNWWYTVTTAIMVNGRWQDLPSHRIVQPLPGIETVNLALIPDQEAPPPPETVTPTEWAIIARNQARQARDEAQDAAGDALESAGAADAAAGTAGTQAAGAGAARAGAENARDAAQISKTDAAASAAAATARATAAAGSAGAAAASAAAADGSATAAAGSADIAQTERTKAETAKTGAESAKTEAAAAANLALAGQYAGAQVNTVQDVNTFRTPGVYRFTGSGVNSTNLPVANAGILQVFKVNGDQNTMQEFRPFSGTAVRRRGYYMRSASNDSTNWDAWDFVSPLRFDKTAGLALYAVDPTSQREQLVYGDTGWREVAIGNGWTGSVRVRRVGYTVEVVGTGLDGTNATSINVLLASLGPGFRPQQNIPVMGRPTSNTSPPVYGSFAASTASLQVPVGSVFNATSGLQFSFTTVDPWPTTLPGTASGTIPNS